LRAALLGATYSWEDWESMLAERFRHGGAYLVYDGELDWDQQSGKRIVPEDIAAADGRRVEGLRTRSSSRSTTPTAACSESSTSGRPRAAAPVRRGLEVLTIVVRHRRAPCRRAQDAADDAAHRRGLESSCGCRRS